MIDKATSNNDSLYYSLSQQKASKAKKIIKNIKQKDKEAEMGLITSSF